METGVVSNFMIIRWFIMGLAITVLAPTFRAQAQPYLHTPSVDTYARHDPQGLTILPTGRYLKPVGRHFPVARWPYGLDYNSP